MYRWSIAGRPLITMNPLGVVLMCRNMVHLLFFSLSSYMIQCLCVTMTLHQARCGLYGPPREPIPSSPSFFYLFFVFPQSFISRFLSHLSFFLHPSSFREFSTNCFKKIQKILEGAYTTCPLHRGILFLLSFTHHQILPLHKRGAKCRHLN